MLSRRELLRGAGAGLAAAALAPLAGACGSQHAQRVTSHAGGADPIRQALRDAIPVIGARLDAPSAYLLERRRVRTLVDVAQAEVADQRQTTLVLAGTDVASGRRFERSIDDVSPARIAAVAAELAALGQATSRAVRAVPPPEDHPLHLDLDPEALSPRGWLDRTRQIAARCERVATSRIIYRASYLTCDDDRIWVVSEGGDRAQRLVRTRMGTTFVAWHGSEPLAGETQVTGVIGPKPELIADAAIARAAMDALALFTPSAPPSGMTTVLLDPAAVAALVDAGLGPLLDPLGPPPPPLAPVITLADDPSLWPGLGSYWYDDDGARGVATMLIDGGKPAGKLGAGSRRRAGATWQLATAPSNLVLAPGEKSAAALEAKIDAGLVIEGARAVDLDPDRGAIVLRSARAREIKSGRRTGRAWDAVEVRGGVRELFGKATDVSSDRATIGIVDDRPPRSIAASWMVTEAIVGSARAGGV